MRLPMKSLSYANGDPMAKENPQISPPVFDAFAVIVAAAVPRNLLERMKAGNMKVSCVVFDQVTASGLTAGDPISVPARDLLPEEAIAVVQRAMSEGTVAVTVAFNPVKPVAKLQRV